MAIFGFKIVIAHHVGVSFGAPLSETSVSVGTPKPTPYTALIRYVDDPNGRETLSSVIACLLILVLCI